MLRRFCRRGFCGIRPRGAACVLLLASSLAAIAIAPAPALADESAAVTAEHEAAARAVLRRFEISNPPWHGDFKAMLERRLIRVAVPYSRSLYFSDRGQERGMSAELVRDFERYLNAKYRKKLGRRPLTVILTATSRDQLVSKVAGGLADVALGNLVITPERLAQVDMVAPEGDKPNMREVVVTGPKSPAIAGLDDLAGRTVHVRRSSSYYDSLQALNARFAGEGKPAIDIEIVPDALEDEDMLEMLNAGLLEAMVVDDWKPKLWAPVLPDVQVHAEAVLRHGRLGWAIRKQSPQLAAELRTFYGEWAKKQGVIPYRFQQFLKRIKQIGDPTAAADKARFADVLALFERYGHRYGFDPLMLAAQGYQESRLDHGARSHVGAIGIMQVMPATGAQMKVGDVRVLEANVHAAAKYMDFILNRYFSDAAFAENDRTLFAFASYNCGPANVARARREAAKRDLDPNRWFDNVEIMVARLIGLETTTYVRNIYKYFVAYRMIAASERKARELRQRLGATGAGSGKTAP